MGENMTKKLLIMLLVVCMTALTACGENQSQTTTTTAAATTKTTTTTTATEISSTSEEATTNSGETGDLFNFRLNDVFEGKYAKFSVSTDWEYGSADINTAGDTSYFYMNDSNNIPFIMYQYESVDGIDIFTDLLWNQVAANLQGERLPNKTINNREFARILAPSEENQLTLLVYYTYENTNKMLQGLAIVYPFGATNEDVYMAALEKVAETFEVKTGNSEMIDKISSVISGETSGADMGQTKEVAVEGGILTVPADFIETSNSPLPLYLKGMAAPDYSRFIMYQYFNLGTDNDIAEKAAIEAYFQGIESKNTGMVEINGKEYYQFEPLETNHSKNPGLLYHDKTSNFIYVFFALERESDDAAIQRNLEFVKEIVRLFKYE